MKKYTYQIIKIEGFDNDFNILNKYLNNAGPGQYVVTLEEFKEITREDE